MPSATRHLFSTCYRQRSLAYTLIEVLAAVGVAGILTCVAVPAYSDYLRRSQLPEAFAALADFRARMEQYYQDNQSYGHGTCADGAVTSKWTAFDATEHFTYACALSESDSGFTVTATGRSGAAVGQVFTIDHNGNRSTSRFKGESVVASCWLTLNGSC